MWEIGGLENRRPFTHISPSVCESLPLRHFLPIEYRSLNARGPRVVHFEWTLESSESLIESTADPEFSNG